MICYNAKSKNYHIISLEFNYFVYFCDTKLRINND